MTRLVPSKREMEAYLDQGLTHQEIAERWEQDSGIKVTRPAISLAIKRYDLKSAHERPRYEEMLPWQVKSEHINHRYARMLRMEQRRRLGKPLKARDKQWLEGFKKRLEEAQAVVAYAPYTEEGFFLTPKTEADGHDMIRRQTVV